MSFTNRKLQITEYKMKYKEHENSKLKSTSVKIYFLGRQLSGPAVRETF